MTAEQLLLFKASESPDFLVTSGSRLYGTSMPESDCDLRGFVVPPFEYLIGIKTAKAVELDGDRKIYTLKRFLDLLLEGDPQTTEIIFAPKEFIHIKTDIAESVFALKEYFLSNKSFARVMGFSNAEWRKAMAVKIVPEKRRKHEPEVINDVFNVCDWLNKEQRDNIRKIIDDGRPKKIISSVAGIGSKRKGQVEKYGYCPKSAAHSIRLVEQITELMLTGNITFPRLNANFLLKIRQGVVPKDDLPAIYEEVRTKAEEARVKSILQDKPNHNKVLEAYAKFVAVHLKRDDRFCNILNK